MKKILLSLIVLIVTGGFTFAQVFTLTNNEGEPLGDTVTVYGDPEVSGIDFGAIFTNNKDENVNISVRRDTIHMLVGTSSYFKWNQTLAPSVDLSEAYIVNAGESTPVDYFKVYYQPYGQIGISIIQFRFQNINSENEFVKLIIKFNTTSDDIDENIIRNMTISDLYPNPAQDMISIEYDMPREVESANVRIVNVLGSVVKEVPLDTRDNKLSIDVSNLNDGIYFYSIFINDELYNTEKLIVK